MEAADVVSLKDPLEVGHDDWNILLSAPSDDSAGNEAFFLLQLLDFVGQLGLSGFQLSLQRLHVVLEVLGGDVAFDFEVLLLGTDFLLEHFDLAFEHFEFDFGLLELGLCIEKFFNLACELPLKLGGLLDLILERLMETKLRRAHDIFRAVSYTHLTLPTKA